MAVSPEMETEKPKVSPPRPSEAVSFCCSINAGGGLGGGGLGGGGLGGGGLGGGLGGGGLGGTSHVLPVQFGSHTHSQLVPLNCKYLPPGGTHFGGSVAVSRASSRVFNPSSVLFRASIRPSSSVSLVFNSLSVVFKASIRPASSVESSWSNFSESPCVLPRVYTSPSTRTF